MTAARAWAGRWPIPSWNWGPAMAMQGDEPLILPARLRPRWALPCAPKEGVPLPSGSSRSSKSSDALLVLRQKGRGRTKGRSGSDFCLVGRPAALSCLLESLLRATDEPPVQALLQTASSTREKEMTPNLAAQGPSLLESPATLWGAESQTPQRRLSEHSFLPRASKQRQTPTETVALKRRQANPVSGRVMAAKEPTAHLETRPLCHGITQGFS